MGDRHIVTHNRVAVITTVVLSRHGCFPPDDAGLEYLRVVFEHLEHLPNAAQQMRKFAAARARWIEPKQLERLISAVIDAPRVWWTNRALGVELNVTAAEVAQHKLRYITPCDLTDEEVKQQELAGKREYARRARRLKRPLTRPREAWDNRTLHHREATLIDTMSGKPDRWWSKSALVRSVKSLPSFRDDGGIALQPKSLGRVVNRHLKRLREAGFIDARQVQTEQCLPAALEFRFKTASTSVAPRFCPKDNQLEHVE